MKYLLFVNSDFLKSCLLNSTIVIVSYVDEEYQDYYKI